MAAELIDTDALQAKIVSLLRAVNVTNASTSDATRRIYDDVPMNVTTAAGEYIEIAGALETEDDASASDGVEHITTLQVYSEHKGFQKVREVSQRIRQALHRETFDIVGVHVINWVDGVVYSVASDGVTRQSVIRVRSVCRT